MSDIDISVVIPVKNGQRYLDQLLAGVFSQKIDGRFEVIILDSGSTDKTLEIAGRYPVQIHKIGAAEFNHGLTRNLGISKAKGSYIILMTQDAVPCGGQWMSSLVDRLKADPCLAGVYSRQLPHKDSSALAKAISKKFFAHETARRQSRITVMEDYIRLSPRQKHRFCSFDNVSSAIRRSVWQEMPFSRVEFAEDLDWSKRVLEAGYGIAYEPDSAVYHSHDFSIRDWYERNKEDSRILYTLFGINDINNIFKLGLFSFLRAGKDVIFLLKGLRQFKPAISDVCLAPVFSVSGVLGRYKGAKEIKNENTASRP